MITLKSMINGVYVTDSVAVYYTVDSNAKAFITKATFCNDHSSSLTITINIVPSGGSATAANRIIKTHTIAASETWSCDDLVGHEIEAGGAISMVASTTNKISARISGFEKT